MFHQSHASMICWLGVIMRMEMAGTTYVCVLPPLLETPVSVQVKATRFDVSHLSKWTDE